MSIYKMCAMWAKTISDGGDESAGKSWKSCNVYFHGKTIYSYGAHFPMGYILGPNLVWLNGDRFSNSTTNHQSEVRGAIQTHAPDATVVIVPNSALRAANVDYRTIQPVHVESERWEYELQTATAPPSDMQPLSALPDKGWHPVYWRGNWATDGDLWADAIGFVVRDGQRQAVRQNSDGSASWHTARHWLGDAVFTGVRDRWFDGTVGERVYFISSFDKQERTPLYFLSLLPHPVSSVAEGIEALAPESVKTARDLGRNAVRQGDMFAIEMGVSTRELRALGATFTKRKVTVTLQRHAAESVAVRDALRTVHEGMPAYPERKYLSDFPATEGNGLYDRDAFDAWHTGYMKACDEWADELLRRFAERFPDMQVSRWGWQSALAYEPRRPWDYIRTVDASALYGTAHTATEVATLPDGRQFARGTMYHDPAVIGENRTADHRRQSLGKRWHLIARNTVPVSGSGSGRRVA